MAKMLSKVQCANNECIKRCGYFFSYKNKRVKSGVRSLEKKQWLKDI